MKPQLKETLIMLAADHEKVKALFQELDRTSELAKAGKTKMVDNTPTPRPVES